MNKKFGQLIVDKIKEKEIKPKSRWQFLLKDYIAWTFGFISFLFGSMSVAVILYMLTYDWGMHEVFNQNLLSYVIISLPYFWLVFLALFIFIIYFNFKHTKHGYRYSISIVFVISVLMSVFVGIFFFNFGLGQAIDDVFSRRAPFYETIINHRMNMWRSAESGHLAGMVIEKKDDMLIMLLAMDRKIWQVDIKNTRSMLLEGIIIGRPIRIIGEKIDENIFKAEIIIPAGPGRDFFKRKHDYHFLLK